MGSKDKKFILAESGHIAGIINPPHKNKYGYYLNENLDTDAEAWQINATHFSGSWWPVWEKWIGSFSGEKVKARKEGSKSYPSLTDAPGTYVLQKS
jgi:polyhydroxyalkanoate synthase